MMDFVASSDGIYSVGGYQLLGPFTQKLPSAGLDIGEDDLQVLVLVLQVVPKPVYCTLLDLLS